MRPRLGGVLSAVPLLALLAWTTPAWCAGDGSEWRSTLPFDTRRPSSPATDHGYRTSSPYTSGDELWWDGFGLPSINGHVLSVAEYRGSVIVAGLFDQAGGRAVQNIARWNGSGWEPMGAGLEGTVTALIVFEGDLIAAGRFDTDGGANVARWDGRSWKRMGPGLGRYELDIVSTLAVVQDELVAGGDFEYSGETPMRNIARWNGDSWRAIGDGMDFHVHAIVEAFGHLVAGGEFNWGGIYPEYTTAWGGGLVRWDGTSWSPVGALQLDQGITRVKSLSIHGGLLIVGGWFDRAGGVDATNIAAWDGTSFTALGSGIETTVDETLTTPEGVLYAGCGEGLRFWDGNVWQAVPGIEGNVGSIRSSGNDLLVVGNFEATGAGNTRAFRLARYSSQQGWLDFDPWTDRMHGLATNHGRSPFVTALGTRQGRVVASGTFDYSGDPPLWEEQNAIAEWDGTKWRSLPSLPGPVEAMLEWDGVLYVAGEFESGDPARPIIPVYRLSPQGWVPMGTSTIHPLTMMVYRGAIHVAGWIPGPLPYPYASAGDLLRWNGTQWETVATVGDANYRPTISSMVELDGRLVIAGRFTSVNGVPAKSVAAWDGTAWEQFGTGLLTRESTGRVNSLAVHQGRLIATGTFEVSGVPMIATVRWVDMDWEIMGTVLVGNGLIGRLVTAGSDLFFIGTLWRPPDPRPLGVVRWDGQDWAELGSGTSGPVYALVGQGDQVFLGGSFSWAGGKSSFGIARWDGGSSAPGSPPSLAPAAPNPFRVATSLTYRLTQAGSVRISVYDAAGREVTVLEQGSKNPGAYAATWNGNGRNGKPAPAGVYFIRAELPGADLARKIVRLR